MPIRVIYVQAGDVPKERRDVWRDLARDCQRMTNLIWRRWELWHEQHGSAERIEAELAAWRATKKKTKGGVSPLNKELANDIYHTCAKRFPSLASRTRTLVQNIIQNKIKKHPGTTALAGWKSILLDHDGRPTTRKVAPVPFDKASSSIVRDGKGLVLRLRIERREVDGRKNGETVIDEVPLLVGRERKEYVAPLFAIADGAATFAGSQLVYLRSKRQWKVAIAYDAPTNIATHLEAGKTLVVRPGAKRPWRMRVDGKSKPLGGMWTHVAHKRQSLLRERFGRAENYRWANRNAKGHGRQRGIADFTKMSQRWRCFCRSMNEQFGHRVVDLAVAERCGKIVFVQWSDERPARYLGEAGQTGRPNATAWPWYGVAEVIKRRAAMLGVEVVVKKRTSKSAQESVA